MQTEVWRHGQFVQTSGGSDKSQHFAEPVGIADEAFWIAGLEKTAQPLVPDALDIHSRDLATSRAIVKCLVTVDEIFVHCVGVALIGPIA